jgi:hypothetical protein
MVHCLINEETGGWNSENVHAFFDLAIAAQIMENLISWHAGDDFVSWPHTRHGTFSVCWAYNLARSRKFIQDHSKTRRGMTSNVTTEERIGRQFGKSRLRGKC